MQINCIALRYIFILLCVSSKWIVFTEGGEQEKDQILLSANLASSLCQQENLFKSSGKIQTPGRLNSSKEFTSSWVKWGKCGSIYYSSNLSSEACKPFQFEQLKVQSTKIAIDNESESESGIRVPRGSDSDSFSGTFTVTDSKLGDVVGKFVGTLFKDPPPGKGRSIGTGSFTFESSNMESNKSIPVVEDDYETHPCIRPCSKDPKSFKVCKYKFFVTHFWALSFECGKCPIIVADCFNPACLTTDGRQRPIAVVNHVFPGPPIRVCQGDTVVVDLRNDFDAESTSIHWHGIHQKSTAWIDGVPFVSQCPVSPGSTFRYKFHTPVSGTHFWHSHSGLQRGNGVFGFLIVRQDPATDPSSSTHSNTKLYDYDLPQHELIVMDWPGEFGEVLGLNWEFATGRNWADGALVNGKGFPPDYFNDFEECDTIQSRPKPRVPIHEIVMEKGKRYRVRLVSNAVYDCAFEVSVEEHEMTIIATDGSPVKARTVSSLVIFAGERYDFVIFANQKEGSYWIKFRGLLDCGDGGFSKTFQLAVLRYERLRKGTFPNHAIKSWEEAAAPTPGNGQNLQLNPLNSNPDTKSYVHLTDLVALNDEDPEIIKKAKADHQFYMVYDFNVISNWNLGRGHIRPHHGPGGGAVMDSSEAEPRRFSVIFLPQFNYLSFKNFISPPMGQPDILKTTRICSESSNPGDCKKEFCHCTHMVKVKLNSIVEFVFVDRGHVKNVSHPIHLHGHSFRVVAMQRLGANTEPEVIKKLDQEGKIVRKHSNAVIKDTVPVPDGGFTMVRFRADNPGFWLVHCHIELHVEEGMAFVIQVGELEQMKFAPPNFPKCGDYLEPPVK